MPLFGGSGGGLFGDGGVAGALQKGIPDDSESEPGDEYRVPMGVDDFDSFGASLIAPGEKVELARWEAPAGVGRRWGYGRADAAENQGRLYGVFQNDSGDQIHGSLIFKWENKTGRATQTVDEHKTDDLDTTERTNRDDQIPMPEATDKNMATQDQYLVVEFVPSTASADVANAYEITDNSELRLPTTEYDRTTA